ncbi:DUF3987 domain-containing protein [Acidiphilium multivorum]|uniref:DUF3987 domain-containing protein n=1 Tax=Acidiphilium multivorum TaxID=62140 RepID=UPI001B8CB0FB|nr:DUF3987 domain-containing protein [Acidiphilium multivorum]MBS3023357.1 DUF3987 domain-containing protein [Acidiphilium multivorum]
MATHDQSPNSFTNITSRLEAFSPADGQLALNFDGITLASLASQRLWVAWHLETRRGKPTKVPLNPATRRPAKSNAPNTWGTREEAEAASQQMSQITGGGVGIQLAELGNGECLGGVDLDTCRDRETGEIANWAREIIQMFRTYAEVSPSQTGIKIYFRFRSTILPTLREKMGTDFGKIWQRGGGEHPPAIELHIGNRYFAVTDQRLEGSPSTIEPIQIQSLLHLICDIGPAFKSNGDYKMSKQATQSRDVGTNAKTLKRLEKTAASFPRLRATLDKMDQHGSRSEAAMALGGALKDLGWAFDEISDALHAHPATTDWAKDKGEAADRRELRRIYDRAQPRSDYADSFSWDEPDLLVAHLHRRSPPALPLQLFGNDWSHWIEEAANAAAAAPDHIAANLLATASGLIGHARWAKATPGWAEPPHLWCATVGDSGTNKSAAADVLVGHVFPELERRMTADFPDRLAEWHKRVVAARAAQEAWKTANGKDAKLPPPPPGLDDAEPHAPRLFMSDVTIENVATILALAAPKGLIIQRDEISGWLLGLNNYNDSGREFWLEANGGRPYRVGRQKLQRPIIIPRLAVAVMGSTQPQKIAQMFRQTDDGLLARFLWFWPEPRPFKLSYVAPASEWATSALDRLRLLELHTDERGETVPINVPLEPKALPLMEAFGQKMQARQQEVGGLMHSALGKARGLALRISLVLEMLLWCGKNGFTPPPTEISVDAFNSATTLVADYLIPMAERVYGDASTTLEQRNAATLARYILKTRKDVVHVRTLQREERLPGLNNAAAIHAAAELLVEAGWLRSPPRGTFQHRRMMNYQVNPRLKET